MWFAGCHVGTLKQTADELGCDGTTFTKCLKKVQTCFNADDIAQFVMVSFVGI